MNTTLNSNEDLNNILYPSGSSFDCGQDIQLEVYTGGYIALETGVIEGATLITTAFPMSWAVEADDFEAGMWRCESFIPT